MVMISHNEQYIHISLSFFFLSFKQINHNSSNNKVKTQTDVLYPINE
jgi:hypothetical protein